ncbi:MAG: cytochrome c3 family protein [Planctomycetota bacterium]
MNHPVFVVPTAAVRVPSDWPLDANGAITCLTCHTRIPGRDETARIELRGFDEGEVGGNPVSFCAVCHQVDGFRSASGTHWLANAKAHIHVSSDESQGWGGRLDDESRRCLGCHDGVGAGETSYETGHNQHNGAFGGDGRNHPVGIAYPRGGKDRNGIRYHIPATLPKSVRLPGGTVGCVSCHDLYSAEPMYLSVRIEGSALCFTCHDMN